MQVKSPVGHCFRPAERRPTRPSRAAKPAPRCAPNYWLWGFFC